MDSPAQRLREHINQAEQLAGPRGEWYAADKNQVPDILIRALVHATLALVAAVEMVQREIGDQHG